MSVGMKINLYIADADDYPMVASFELKINIFLSLLGNQPLHENQKDQKMAFLTSVNFDSVIAVKDCHSSG
jgi:hypothetical protein